MNNVASGYYALGRHAEGVKLYEETLALRKTSLGPDHPETLTSMNNLASLPALGRHAEGSGLTRRPWHCGKSAWSGPRRYAQQHEQPRH